MKVVKIVLGVIGAMYLATIIFLTVCLLNYNDHGITEFKNKMYLIIENDEIEPNFQEGSLVVVAKTKTGDIKTGDNVFFYNTYNEVVEVNFAKVIAQEKVTEEETTFTLEGDKPISSSNVIGIEETAKEYKKMGAFLGFLESRWGYLFIVIVPILFIFIYEIYAVVKEVKVRKKTVKE